MNIRCKVGVGTVPVLFYLMLVSLPAKATTISFVATNLPDVSPGEDLWNYTYSVSGHTFPQFSFFDIYFDPALFGTLTAGPPPNADWDAAVLQQPNPVNLPPFDTGIFDAFAFVDNPSLAGVFSVDFVFLGAGVPGAQPFDVFDADSGLVESGVTTLSSETVPEPSTTALFLMGVVLVALHSHRRSAHRRARR